MPTFINFTNAPVDLNVAGKTIQTVEPDGRLCYRMTDTNDGDPIALVTAEDGTITPLTLRTQKVVAMIVSRDLASGKFDAFPGAQEDVFYIVPADVSLTLRRADVGWIDNSDLDNTCYYTGRPVQ